MKLTTSRAAALPPPAKGYAITWCSDTPGFGCRVTAAGGRSWVTEGRLSGRTVRRTLAPAAGRGAISDKKAREKAEIIWGELRTGTDRLVTERAKRTERKRVETEEALTFATALRDYVQGKRRAKDKLPLKPRTVADYLAMVAGVSTVVGGRQVHARSLDDAGKPVGLPGELYALADRPLAQLKGDEIRKAYKDAAKRGERRASYAMQVLRAVLRWHGVAIEGNPFGTEVAPKERITIGKTAGDPNPIPPERLAAWWRASKTAGRAGSASFYRLMLLTGARGGELKSATVRDFDPEGKRLTLRDTKSRNDHTVLLSTQAAEIVAAHAEGKRPNAALFDLVDTRKTFQAINKAAGVDITPHDLRATFASVAEELVSVYALKRMLNHTLTTDVTGSHYVGKSETQLRAAWQTVADFIEAAK